MGVVSNNDVKVTYEHAIMFRYSPNIISIERLSTIDYVTVIVRSMGQATGVLQFKMTFGGNSNVLRLNLTRALQALGGEDVEVVVITPNSTSVNFAVSVIDGAKSLIDDFAGPYAIRTWPGFEPIFDFIISGSTAVYLTGKGSLPQIIGQLSTNNRAGYSLRSFSYDTSIQTKPFTVYAEAMDCIGDVWELSTVEYNVRPVTCNIRKPSIFLRWKDLQGRTWQWMFEIAEVSHTTNERLSYGRLPISMSGVTNEWTTERNKTVQQRMRVVATGITADEYKVVKTLASSSVVDAFVVGADVWYRVRVADGEFTEAKENYREFEVQIEFPTQETQLS